MLAAIALAVGVIVVSLAVFDWRQQTRVADLDRQYARTAAHVGRQVELLLESYQRVASNLEPVAYGGRPTTEALDLVVESRRKRELLSNAVDVAEAQVAAAKEAEHRAEAQTKLAKERSAKLSAALDAAGRDARKKKQTAVETATTLEAKLVEVEAAATAVQKAALEVEAVLEQAKGQAEKAEAAAENLRRIELVEGRPAPKPLAPPPPPPPVDDATGVDAPTPSTPASDYLDAADAADHAAASYERALATYKSAKDEYERLQRQVETLDNEALAALRVASAASTRQETSEALADEQASARTEAEAAQRVSAERRERLDRELADLVAQRSSVDAATEKTRMALEKLGDLVIGAAPPSYRRSLAQCLDDGDEPSRVQCIFRRLLQANGIDPSQGRYVECESPPDAGALPRFARDGQAVHFPLSRKGSLATGCLRVDIGSLLAEPGESPDAPWLNPREAGFAEVVLLDRSGTVLRSDPESAIRLERLPGFDPSALVSSRTEGLEIGTDRYRAYVQPVATRIAPASSEAEDISRVGLVVVALVSESQFTSETLEIGYAGFLVAAFLVGLVVLAFPLAKLWSVGARSPYSRLDVSLLASASGIIALVITVAGWSVLTSGSLGSRLDRQLHEVADALERALDHRIAGAQGSLDAFVEDTAPLRRAYERQTDGAALASACERAAWVSPARWPGFSADDDDAVYCERVAYGFATRTSGQTQWRQASWSDLDGNQRLKFAGGPHAAVPVNVRNRAYFSAAQQLTCDGIRPTKPIAQVVRSASTLESIVVVAQPTCVDDDPGASVNGVASISYAPDILQSVVPPPEMRMAVLDASGRVMLHSDSGVFHGHAFFEDVDDDRELRALIDSRRDGVIDVRYLQTQVRLRVQYVASHEWFIVTMAPIRLVDGAVTGMVVLTLLGCGLFFLVELSLLGLGGFIARVVGYERHRSRWGTPQPTTKKAWLYRVGGLAGLGLGALTVALTIRFPIQRGGLWAGVVLLIVLASTFWLLPRTPWLRKVTQERRELEANQPRISVRYTLWYVGLAAVFYVCPASLVFGSVYDRVVENRLRAEQVHCVQASASADTDSSICVPAMEPVAVRAPLPRGQAAAGIATAATVAGSDGNSVPPHFVDLLPGFWLSQHLGGHLHRIGWDAEQRTRWVWQRQADRLDLLYEPEGATVALSSPMPRPGDVDASRSMRLVAVAALVLVLMSLASLLYVSLRRLHFLRVLDRGLTVTSPAPRTISMQALWDLADTDDKRHILVALATTGIATPHPRLECAVRELAEAGLLQAHDLQLARVDVDGVEIGELLRDLHASGGIPLSEPPSGTWETVRMPLLTTLVVLVAALGASEPELGATGLLVPTLAAALPAVFRVLGAIGRVAVPPRATNGD